MGTAGPESSNERGRSKLIAFPYADPSTWVIHMRTARVIRSGRSARTICSCWKPPRRFHSCGSGIDSGCSASHHSFQRFQEPSTSAGSVAKSSITEMATTEPQAESGSQEPTGFSLELSFGAKSNTSSSAGDISLFCIATFIASCVEKMSRCRSKRPRVTNAKSDIVIESCRQATRALSVSAGVAFARALLKMKLNAASEYWYMWSMTLSWFIKK
mmetsp:Transcript_40202/g.99643  ORF Transcript_40202/g.99643 Transcript_40202/m.99643 type:complete len:215 (+) Transcript_40202:1941-2585(+)